MGKTRLAVAAAAGQSAKFHHGAVFVPLAGVSTAHFLPQAILSALNVPLQGDLSPQQQVRAVLYSQECLLVLDNYEHLLPEI
ncbi:MAG: LuxR family transcriptional regulator, partial [Anaerolineae bacterium]|nr:LuxR family transcriptional regulator [Anaerolineae bacterium]